MTVTAETPTSQSWSLPELPSWLRRPLPAFAVLLSVYLALSLVNDPGGFLGADTGAKVYTLEVMDRNDTFGPDIGYWAEDLDPDGSVHPIHHTRKRSDGSWVAVTTLPMLEAAAPLYRWGGYRAILVLPMLAGVAAAFAARAVARRIDGSDGWAAFWLVGLASPVVVYSLDFWEHTAGLATMVGAVAVLLAILDGRPSWFGTFAGLLLGIGSTMRNETLVYAAVTVGVACVVLVARGRLRGAVGVGVASLVGFAGPWLANVALERAVDGQSRASRATATAADVTTSSRSLRLGQRAEEGLQTFVGLVSGDPWLSILLGSAVVLAVVAAIRAERRSDRTFAIVALGAAAAVYAADAIGGLGFIPGLLVAFPVAIAGLFVGSLSTNGRIVVAMALLALPLAYLFQFLGGAGPQWGGRYTLTSAVLLGVAGLGGLVPRLPVVGRGLLALTVAVTILGVAWISVRSNDVAEFFDDVQAKGEPVLIARQAFLLREGGAAVVDRRWLSAENEQEFTEGVDIARQLGEERFTVLEWDGAAPPDAALPDDVREVSRDLLSFAGTPVGILTYEFVPT